MNKFKEPQSGTCLLSHFVGNNFDFTPGVGENYLILYLLCSTLLKIMLFLWLCLKMTTNSKGKISLWVKLLVFFYVLFFQGVSLLSLLPLVGESQREKMKLHLTELHWFSLQAWWQVGWFAFGTLVARLRCSLWKGGVSQESVKYVLSDISCSDYSRTIRELAIGLVWEVCILFLYSECLQQLSKTLVEVNRFSVKLKSLCVLSVSGTSLCFLLHRSCLRNLSFKTVKCVVNNYYHLQDWLILNLFKYLILAFLYCYSFSILFSMILSVLCVPRDSDA